MRIDYDKVSGALYIKIREGTYSHSEDFSEKADVYLDVDAEGNVLGLEALSFEDLTQAAEERGGKLEIPDVLRESIFEFHTEQAFRLHAERDLDLQKVREAVEALEPRKKEAIWLRYMEGVSTSDIATRWGVPLGTVILTIRAALQDLRETLKPEFEDEENEASLEEALTMIA